MKSLTRAFLINLAALWVASTLISALVIRGGIKGLLISAVAFMIVNALVVPILKIILLPLNLLTLGLFAWMSNVLALYFLVSVIPTLKLFPYNFPGANLGGIILPAVSLTTFQSAIVVSLLIGFIIHVVYWLIK